MNQQTIRKSLLRVIPAIGVFGMVFPATAGADPGALQPPVVEFHAENGGSVYGMIENPNDHGVCWAENADTGAVFTVGPMFHNFPVEESVAGPGAVMVRSLDNDKSGPVRVVGRCADHLPPAADDPAASASEVVTVETVVTGIPLTGSSGG
ncbi:hypothetical protein ACFWPH_00155 [Nocardia sp. NPDC058499]|uniref:hypothetical protein n=1 Tax=Nocardia sp. NPDC058499 TaxID=3346530 RepID=UPI00364B3A25